MTITKEQLDELERLARAAGSISWYKSHDVHLDYMRDVDAAHIAANSPDVTLQLVAIARAAMEWMEARTKQIDNATHSSRISVDDQHYVIDAERRLIKVLRGTP